MSRFKFTAYQWWLRLDRSPARVLRWMVLWLVLWTAIVLTTPVALILRWTGVRFLNINYRRIGHLAVEPDCFVKEGILGQRPKIIPFGCAPQHAVCNHTLLDCWRPYIHWITSPLLCIVLRPLDWHPLLGFDVGPYMIIQNEGSKYVNIANQWHGRPPVIALAPGMLDAGRTRLKELGVPQGAWFVCVHNREGGYSPADEDWHSYRNCPIEDYSAAMELIADAGGWCVRIGDPAMKPMPPIRNSIDYAHHSLRDEWMDIYLLANCRFYLGNSSGPFLVSALFNRPVALANMTPVGGMFPYGPGDLGIPKLVTGKGSSEILSFREMFESPSSRYSFTQQFEQEGLIPVNNSPEDIAALAAEMLEIVEGTWACSKADEVWQEYVKSLLRPHHICYGTTSRVGREFLRKYIHLIDR